MAVQWFASRAGRHRLRSSPTSVGLCRHPAAQAPTDAREAFAAEVREGLRADPKWLSPKWLYDEAGSRLFDEITTLPEYYPTRVESGIMERWGVEMAEAIGEGALLLEFGSGSSTKTRLLLDRLPALAGYVPIDISEEHLLQSADALRREYPHLEVLPVVADYTEPIDLPEDLARAARRVAYFPGSTIGNFHPDEALLFLRRIAGLCGSHGGLLIGVDLKKDPRVLHAAYNDSLGVTARFNLNLLTRMNRELAADFDPSTFVHYAFYNPEEGRVEMHVVSLCEQRVTVSGEQVVFEAGESLWTESSYKYSVAEFGEMAAGAGFSIQQVWTDESRWFGVLYLELVE